jgi:hypothetical protein
VSASRDACGNFSINSQNDLAGVMSMVAEGDVLVMGSDLQQICSSRAHVEELLRDDFKLWDRSSVGKIRMVSTQRSGKLITAFFDAPFPFRRGNNEQTVVARFATAWKRISQGRMLVQRANSTPTVEQSAQELLGRIRAAAGNRFLAGLRQLGIARASLRASAAPPSSIPVCFSSTPTSKLR